MNPSRTFPVYLLTLWTILIAAYVCIGVIATWFRFPSAMHVLTFFRSFPPSLFNNLAFVANPLASGEEIIFDGLISIVILVAWSIVATLPVASKLQIPKIPIYALLFTVIAYTSLGLANTWSQGQELGDVYATLAALSIGAPIIIAMLLTAFITGRIIKAKFSQSTLILGLICSTALFITILSVSAYAFGIASSLPASYARDASLLGVERQKPTINQMNACDKIEYLTHTIMPFLKEYHRFHCPIELLPEGQTSARQPYPTITDQTIEKAVEQCSLKFALFSGTGLTGICVSDDSGVSPYLSNNSFAIKQALDATRSYCGVGQGVGGQSGPYSEKDMLEQLKLTCPKQP